MLKPEAGIITLCQYCGEQCGNSQKYCKDCRTQNGRKEIFLANAKLLKENLTRGFKIPETLKNWK